MDMLAVLHAYPPVHGAAFGTALSRMHVPLLLTCMSLLAGYKYREVVRNRAERAQLPGYECPDCTRFYDALQTWGAAPLPPPTCGHAAFGVYLGRP